jgi:response regulator RpfG family c-di-GMP phosphodiesterase
MGGEVGVESRRRGQHLLGRAAAAAVGAAGRPARERGERARAAARRAILLVEDNPVNMMIAVATLAQWGVDVAEARDGRAAIDAVHDAARRGRPFDLVLMDVQMPVMSGHEAAAELRRTWDASACRSSP